MRPWSGQLVTLPQIEPAVLAMQSDCVPDGAVVLSYMNDHHKHLRLLQFERVKRSTCFMARVVSVCYGAGDGFGSCVHAPAVPPSVFRRGAYIELLWAKWRLIHAALAVARTVLFLDSDVVLLRNPFTAAHMKRRHDIRFQTSLACPARTCAAAPRFEGVQHAGSPPVMRPCQLNGGVLLVSSGELVGRVLALEPVAIGSRNSYTVNHADIDQDMADQIARGGEFSFCPLPPSHFVGHCFNRQVAT